MSAESVTRSAHSRMIIPRHEQPVRRARLPLVDAFKDDSVLPFLGNLHQCGAHKIYSRDTALIQNLLRNDRIGGVAIIERDQAWYAIIREACRTTDDVLNICWRQNPVVLGDVVDEPLK